MIGISLVGYSGSLIKDAVKANASLIGLLRSSTHFLDDLPPPEPSEEPEVTKVLVGPYSTIRSMITATLAFTDLSTRPRRLLHPVCAGVVRDFCVHASSFAHLSSARRPLQHGDPVRHRGYVLCRMLLWPDEAVQMRMLTKPPPLRTSRCFCFLPTLCAIASSSLYRIHHFTEHAEKIMARYSVAPLVAVGWEGLFGALTIVLAMPLLAHYSQVSPFFDLPRGWHQMIDTPTVLWSGVAIAISISLFNYFGLSVTRHVSATVRSLTDTCRTLSIWIVSLGLGWERLMWPISVLQVLGFGLLV